jgi:hypothetical protein
MPRITWDANGFARGFPYHDGFLDGILVSESGSEASLALRSTQGERRILTLRGVVALDMGGFREGNIILNIRMVPSARAAAVPELRKLLSDRLLLDAVTRAPNAVVFLLEPSYGAEVVAVCAEADISESGATMRVDLTDVRS